ncbi:MAG: arginine--tRNA ligase [Candidatus Pacebacteria bacterium]|nr:arginine--tRNA ligase [Candidatus Paceibacterota bacterium]
MEEAIRKATEEALAELGATGVNFAVEWPGDMTHGDYAVNAAMAAAKVVGKNPRELASELAPRITEKLGILAASVEVAGPGFINVTLARDFVARAVTVTTALAAEWGTNDSQFGKRVMIEYSNPNPFKEIHIGHLMSNVIGEALSRVITASGAMVLRDTFGGDVGPHVAKALWALMQTDATDITTAKEIGDAYIQGSNAYEEVPKAKEEIDALNTRIYDIVAKQDDEGALSDEDCALLELWRKGREISMEEFARIFELLGTKFDYIFYDSDTTEVGMRVVRDGVERGIFKESEGAIIYEGEKKGLHTLVFITSRGTPTYETKDIGLAFLKEERDSTDEVLIVTAVEQEGHFKVFLAALEEIAPLLAKKTKHVAHGLLQLTTGKMSSRKGNVITASELIEEVTERASQKNDDPLIAEQVAIGAVKYMILRQAAGSNIVFDIEKSLSLEGDSGPYLQYALVRAKSVVAQAEKDAAERSSAAEDAPAEAYELERLIIRFPEIVRRAQAELAPHHLAHYLTQLASEWNSFYAKERIIGGTHEAYKLELARAFAQTMQNGLNFLGIPAPERM